MRSGPVSGRSGTPVAASFGPFDELLSLTQPRHIFCPTIVERVWKLLIHGFRSRRRGDSDSGTEPPPRRREQQFEPAKPPREFPPP
jgi:hypothetical protein